MSRLDCAESSNLLSARYNPAERGLEVEFKNPAGIKVSTYRYAGVEPEIWEAFNRAASKGKFFALEIRNAKDGEGNPRYPAVRV